MVSKASNRPAIRRSSSPFVMPLQPSALTVLAEALGTRGARSAGRFSSRRTRTGQHGLFCKLKCGNGLRVGDRRELPKELVQRLPPLEIVEEGLGRNAGPDEDRGSPEDLGVRVDDGREIHGSEYKRRGEYGPKTGPSGSVVDEGA